MTLLAAAAALAVLLAGAGSSATAAEAGCPNALLRTGPSAALPDCRGYEQVSPVEKSGQDAYPDAIEASPTLPAEAAPSGEALSYESFGAFAPVLGNTALLSGHVSRREADGAWRTYELTPVKSTASSADYFTLFNFSEDLSRVFLRASTSLPGTNATEGVFNLYETQPGVGGARWINDVTPPVLPPEGCPESNATTGNTCYQNWDLVAFAGASTNSTHVIFESDEQLTPNASPTPAWPGVENLYENSGGKVTLVGVLPDGRAAEPTGTSPALASTAGSGSVVMLSGADGRFDHAISDSGSRIVFQAAADEGGPDAAQHGLTEVYDRLGGTRTLEVSAPAQGAAPAVTSPEPAKFWAASANGERVFFTSRAELTTVSNTGSENTSEDLYECRIVEAGGAASCALADLTPDSNPADAATGAGVLGVIGAAANGSYIYFVATGQLDEREGVDGQPNLYVVHNGGRPHFIATLSAADSRDWAEDPLSLSAYVTPDGQHLAFTSVLMQKTANFPAGYDNADRFTGAPDSEVYEYSASEGSAGSGLLACASCVPSGAAPVGDAYIGAQADEGPAETLSTPLYHPRVVSENGMRVFFSSPPLTYVPGQTAYSKLYEYEADGEGTCDRAAGCTYLLSGAAEPAPAVFLDASATGADVYFAARGQLATTDHDGLVDIYDARVYGGTPAALAPSSACAESCRGPVPQLSGPALVSGLVGATGNIGSFGALPGQRFGRPRPTASKGRRRRRLARCVRAARRHRRRRRRRVALARCRRKYARHTALRRRRNHKGRHGSHRLTSKASEGRGR